MKYLVTGAKGFIARNLVVSLKQKYPEGEILAFTRADSEETLKKYAEECDFVFHLAGVNRPESEEEFYAGNVHFTEKLLKALKNSGKKVPVLFSSSIHAEGDSAYGKSKKQAEELIRNYGREQNVPVYIYRLPNVFGAGAKPNYNSAVATFCYNSAKGLPITVTDPEKVMTLCFVGDVADEFAWAAARNVHKDGDFCYIPVIYRESLGNIAKTVVQFAERSGSVFYPEVSDKFRKLLYGAFTSYLPIEKMKTELTVHADYRGSFTEASRTDFAGQYSINKAVPGITKGNHWHRYKAEKFLTVAGKGRIRLRHINEDKIYTFDVSGDKPEIIDIPCLYTHSIENTGDTEMITLMWISENFNPDTPDTFAEPVIKEKENE